MFKKLSHLSIVAVLFLLSCSGAENTHELDMNNIAESYVKLVLELGLYDPDYVDAYYGPEEWKPAKIEGDEQGEFPHGKLSDEAARLIEELEKLNQSEFKELEKLRYAYLKSHLLSVKAKIDFLSGKRVSFDEESKALYGAVAPVHDEDYFKNILEELDKILPGEGDIYERVINYRKEFIIPKEKLDVVFKAAIAECRRRTLKYIQLPAEENFVVEFVTDKPWSGYNWYKGNFFSLIQVNTDLPVYIDGAIGLASHEGYPGHHVNFILLEKHLVKEKNWIEHSVLPLFSPQSLMAEGMAEYARIDLVIPGDERVEFERRVLFPLAGLDQSKAEEYFKIMRLKEKLRYGSEEAARRYLDGKINKDEAINWLQKYCLLPREEAEKLMQFFERYRSYIINYSLGRDIVEDYMKAHTDTKKNHSKRWELFYTLLSQPQTPIGLQ